MLQKFSDDFSARADGQRTEFGQRLLRAEFGNLRRLRRRVRGGIAGCLGGSSQRAAPDPGTRLAAGAGTRLKADQKSALPERTTPVRRGAIPDVAGLAERSRFGRNGL